MYVNTRIPKYRELVAKMESKVRLVQSEKAAELKKVELQYFHKHGKLPAKTPGSQYYNILKERNLATAILRTL